MSASMPYAPVGSTITVIRKMRNGGLPSPLNGTTITRLGVTQGNAGRTVATIKFLGFVDEHGHETDLVGAISKASTSEYPEVLGDILRQAYAEIFGVIDPSTATDLEFDDAFRGFDPLKQRGRMVKLFVGLCQEAGIKDGEPSFYAPRKRKDPPPKQNGSQSNASQNGNGHLVANPVQETPPQAKSKVEKSFSSESYPILSAYFSQLPADNEWTSEESRNKWLQGIELALGFETQIASAEKITLE